MSTDQMRVADLNQEVQGVVKIKARSSLPIILFGPHTGAKLKFNQIWIIYTFKFTANNQSVPLFQFYKVVKSFILQRVYKLNKQDF